MRPRTDAARLPKELSIRTDTRHDRLTHYLFRYPAKFHPPVVQALLEQFTEPGQMVLDPFCGSGTLLVEAAFAGRSSVGLDVDPVAIAVTRAKIRRFRPDDLADSAEVLLQHAKRVQRAPEEYERRMFRDLSDVEFEKELKGVRSYVPAIPGIEHWFRRYVIVDLARMRKIINNASIPSAHRDFFWVVFASIIRNASNADPVPVSGVEVTAHMRRRDTEGRLVDPVALFSASVEKAVDAAEEYYFSTWPDVSATARVGDAMQLQRGFRRQADAIITSPPYHGAVEYYRRHQLEMFWLGFTASQADRLALLDRYIGRPRVPQRDPLLIAGTLPTALAKEWDARIRAVSAKRADAFRHYMLAMHLAFEGMASALPPSAPAILVVGHSTWQNAEIPTVALFEELSGRHFSLGEILSYPIKNRYMSYARRNGASISTEYVLVLRRNRARVV